MHLFAGLFAITLKEKPLRVRSALTIVSVMLETVPTMQQGFRKELRIENMDGSISIPQGCLGYTKSCVFELQLGL